MRAGWLSALDTMGVPYVVAIGDGSGEQVGDVLRVDAPDDYEGLPQKTLAAIRWVYENTSCLHMLKIDDDCFLNPEEFFGAIGEWRSAHASPFELVVLGEAFAEVPPCFAQAERRFAEQIVHWGHAPDRRRYLELLASCDVLVSTARHEFFGLSAAEALCCGCWLLAPERLAYPELVGIAGSGELYGSTEALVGALERLAGAVEQLRQDALKRASTARRSLSWSGAAGRLDQALSDLTASA